VAAQNSASNRTASVYASTVRSLLFCARRVRRKLALSAARSGSDADELATEASSGVVERNATLAPL
jgi:hypothetical protein